MPGVFKSGLPQCRLSIYVITWSEVEIACAGFDKLKSLWKALLSLLAEIREKIEQITDHITHSLSHLCVCESCQIRAMYLELFGNQGSWCDQRILLQKQKYVRKLVSLNCDWYKWSVLIRLPSVPYSWINGRTDAIELPTLNSAPSILCKRGWKICPGDLFVDSLLCIRICKVWILVRRPTVALQSFERHPMLNHSVRTLSEGLLSPVPKSICEWALHCRKTFPRELGADRIGLNWTQWQWSNCSPACPLWTKHDERKRIAGLGSKIWLSKSIY